MRFLLVNRHYGNQQVPTARMLADVAAVLSDEGHGVVVLTSRSSYVPGRDQPGDAGRSVVRRVVTAGESHRLISWIMFWVQACLMVPWMRWDRLVILTDPPFMAPIARLVRLRPGRRMVYLWTMDLYPESLVAHGAIRSSGIADRFLRGLVNWSFPGLTGVISLGEEQTRRLRTYSRWRAEPGFSLIQPPWDSRPLRKVDRSTNRFIAAHGLDSHKIALYAGNLGMAHSYREILDAARALTLEGDTEWRFVFVVRGTGRTELEQSAADLPNVTILDYQPEELTADLMWAADLHLITMKPGWEGVVVPSKLYGVLKTTAPVLFVGPPQSDTAREVLSLGAGSVAPADVSGADLAATMRALEKHVTPPAEAARSNGADAIASFVSG